jgi:hypothetical protein
MGKFRTHRRKFGRPHRDYARRKKELDSIFDEDFPDIENDLQTLGKIGHETQIPQSTLYRWHKTWRTDQSWRPWREQAHAEHQRIFTKEEEEAIREFIVTNYLIPARLFTNQEFREVAVDAFLTKYRDCGRVPEFNCSDGFIHSFKDRNNFSSRRSHYKRRPDYDQTVLDEWVDEMRKVISTTRPDRIVNCDETCWRVFPTGLRTWGSRGSDNIRLLIRGNEKDSLTALCSVTAARTKLPMVLIATGKTERAERSQLGDISPHIPMHSESGWVTAENFEEYLRLLKQQLPGDDLIYLVLDCYSVHRNQRIRDAAADLGIVLKFVPAGMTDELQPLDRAVFGIMKSAMRRMWRQYCADCENPRLTLQVGAQFLMRAWERVSAHVIANGWRIDEGDDGDLDDGG